MFKFREIDCTNVKNFIIEGQTKKKINEEKFLGFVLRWHRQAAGQN